MMIDETDDLITILSKFPQQALTTFDPLAHTASVITLTNDLKTAVCFSATGDTVTKATWGFDGGSKVYFEYNMDVLTKATPGSNGIGIANVNQSVTGAFVGDSNNSFGWYDDGSTFLNGVGVGTLAIFSQSNRMRIAVDRVNNKFWGATDTGNWNNVSTDNPETNNGGINISAITGTLLAAINLHDNDTTSIVASRRQLLYPVPRGFTTLI